MEEKPGDILVFLTGQDEIESVDRLVRERLQHLPEDSRKLLPLSIFAALPSEQQMRAFAPAPTGFRKVWGGFSCHLLMFGDLVVNRFIYLG